MTYLFQVTIEPEINGKEHPARTFSSENSFDHCYEMINRYLSNNFEKEDKKVYHILHTSSQVLP